MLALGYIRLFKLLLIGLMALGLTHLHAQGQTPHRHVGEPCSLHYLAQTAWHTPSTLTKPQKGDWQRATAGLGLVAIGFGTDALLHKHYGQGLNQTAWEPIKHVGWLPAHGLLWVGTYAIGQMGAQPRWCKAGTMGLQSLALTSLLAGGLKIGTGRARPSHAHNPWIFSAPNTHDGFHSFVSGHSAVAWSSAHILAGQTQKWWIKSLAYGGAASVSVARVATGHHWPSDVVAGALTGLLAAEIIKRTHRMLNQHHKPQTTAIIKKPF